MNIKILTDSTCDLPKPILDACGIDLTPLTVVKDGAEFKDGITITMDEDFGERSNGADGSTLWSEYMGSSGTIDIVVMANSPVYAYFVTLQAAQRASGTKGRDTLSITNRDFNEAFTASKCAIQRISGEKIDKRGNATRTITISAGSITRVAS